jgi:hypothetical protein
LFQTPEGVEMAIKHMQQLEEYGAKNVRFMRDVQPAMGMLKVKYIMNKHVKGNVMLN